MKKQILAFTLSLAMAVGTVGVSPTYKATAQAETQQSTKQAYMNFVSSLKMKQAYKNGVYYAVKNTSKDSSPVLLVTDGCYKDRKKNCAIDAKLYNFVNGKVVYVGKVCSTGTAYPLCVKGKYILTGFHHSATKTTVSGKSAYQKTASGFYMEKGYNKCFIETAKITNGKKKMLTKKKVSAATAEKNDYYSCDKGYAGKVINFIRK